MTFTFLPCEVNLRDFEKVLEPSCPKESTMLFRERMRERKHPINFGLVKMTKFIDETNSLFRMFINVDFLLNLLFETDS